MICEKQKTREVATDLNACRLRNDLWQWMNYLKLTRSFVRGQQWLYHLWAASHISEKGKLLELTYFINNILTHCKTAR